MLSDSSAAHRRTTTLPENMSLRSEGYPQGISGQDVGGWHANSAAAVTLENRLLQKVAAIEQSEQWQKNPIFGSNPVLAWMRLNLGVFGFSSGRILAHVRPTLSRFDEFTQALLGGMLVWNSFAVTLCISEAQRVPPYDLTGGHLLLYQIGTALWVMLAPFCVGCTCSIVAQGVAIMSTPAAEMEGYLSRNAYAFSSVMSGGFTSFYFLLVAFSVRVVAVLTYSGPEANNTAGIALTMAGLGLGLVWAFCCTVMASNVFLQTRRPWVAAKAELAAAESIKTPAAEKTPSTPVFLRDRTCSESDDEYYGDANMPGLDALLERLERIRALHESGFLTTKESDAAQARAKAEGPLAAPRSPYIDIS